jgi:hypothetical protein
MGSELFLVFFALWIFFTFFFKGGRISFPVRMAELKNTIQYKTVDLIQIQLEQVPTYFENTFFLNLFSFPRFEQGN